MNTRNRIYVIITLSIAILFLIIAIVQSQIDSFSAITKMTEEEVKNFLSGYLAGFPKPWE
ncbi:MAG: hypothetical protein K9W45_10170 [Candidatus Heimdallarchaeum aukensis]|uniref:Uncharacterized protein n=2 Tax=Candidatus Heimdallarchaeum TaxID=3053649 RepID=A0A9Y1BQ77_9ARCH|nr:MAG: hypothetical protein K9W45_10170 [Candidatus Heimdallarchaeum aukensis]UJG42905.1 MAG: hypothetical protein K9W46_11060 [Candidatus Heimdallarchaeum endolithica]